MGPFGVPRGHLGRGLASSAIVKPWLLVPLLVAPLALSACGTEEPAGSVHRDDPATTRSQDSSAGPGPGTASAVASDTDPLVLDISTTESEGCWRVAPRKDVAWFEVTWRANEDLEAFEFDLDTEGPVKQIGQALTVSPVNFGGRIDTSGEVPWGSHRAHLTKNRFLLGETLGSVDSSSPTEGETGMLVFRLRFDAEDLESRTARIVAVNGSYETVDGEQGEVSLSTRFSYRAGTCT